MKLRERAATALRLLAASAAIAVGWATFKIVLHGSEWADRWWLSTTWMALWAITPLTFWVAVRNFRRSWKDRRFWLSVGALVAAHVLGHGLLIWSIHDWKFIWTLLLAVIEVQGLIAILLWLGFHAGASVRR